MKGYGIGMAIAGLLLAVGALLMGSTVAQEVPYSVDLPSLTRTEQMHNLPKAQLQLLLFMGGCALFLGGTIMGSLAQLEESVVRRFSVRTEAPILESQLQPDAEAPLPIDPEVLAAQEAARQEWAEQGKKSERVMTIGAFVVIALVGLAVFVANMTSKPTSALPNVAAAEMTADNLEAMADNLEAQATDAMTEIDGAPR